MIAIVLAILSAIGLIHLSLGQLLFVFFVIDPIVFISWAALDGKGKG